MLLRAPPLIALGLTLACSASDRSAGDGSVGDLAAGDVDARPIDLAISLGTVALGGICERDAHCLAGLVCFRMPSADSGFCTAVCKVVDQPCDLAWGGRDLCLVGRGDNHCVPVCWLKGTGQNGKSYPCPDDLTCGFALDETRKICAP